MVVKLQLQLGAYLEMRAMVKLHAHSQFIKYYF